MKNIQLKKVVSGLVLAGFVSGYSLQASAAPQCPENLDPLADYKCVIIDTQTDPDLSGSTKTGAFYELGLTGTLATSVYTPGLAMGSAVYDTNITSKLNSFGIVGNTTGPSVAEVYFGAPAATPDVNIKDTATTGEKNIDALNGTADTNALNQSNIFFQGWTLTFDYYLEGTLTAGGPVFNDGYFDFFYDDLATALDEHIQVLHVDILGSVLSLASLDLKGLVNFDFDGDADLDELSDPFLAAFWNFQTGTPSDWATLFANGVTINWALDTNVNPPFPTLTSLREFTNEKDDESFWVRQTTLDSSIRHSVPEPSSIALLGLGLAGLAASLRKRKKA